MTSSWRTSTYISGANKDIEFTVRYPCYVWLCNGSAQGFKWIGHHIGESDGAKSAVDGSFECVKPAVLRYVKRMCDLADVKSPAGHI